MSRNLRRPATGAVRWTAEREPDAHREGIVRHPNLLVAAHSCVVLVLVLSACVACSTEDSRSTDTESADGDVPIEGGPCSTDVECARGLICSVQALCTAVTCTTRQDCGQNRVCFQERCFGIECGTDEDCEGDARLGPGYRCESNLCQPPRTCVANVDCAALLQVCSGGLCADPPSVCSVDADCVHPTVCDASQGACVDATPGGP